MKVKYLSIGIVLVVCSLVLCSCANARVVDSIIYENKKLHVKNIEKNSTEKNVRIDVTDKVEEKLPQIMPVEISIEKIESTWTEEDLEMLACTIYCEAGADYISDETRLMVGSVVMNRVDHYLYPDTICEVITQKRQYGRFYWTGVVWPDRAKKSEESHAVQRAYDIAERVLNGERVLDKNYIFQAEFKQTSDYIYQDGMYFCRYAE